ncbi:MAG: hypothetical protein WCR07_09095 [Verrucomicrobiota bacterium]|jgi:hypothetical protein
MKTTTTSTGPGWVSCFLGLATLLSVGRMAPPLNAYPPALPHTIEGMVRDELGNPLVAGAIVSLEADSGVKVYATVSALLAPGVNYRMTIPLDAGLTSEAYRPTALNPAAPFKMRVRLGGRTFLPIEMTIGSKSLGEPGMMTRINLTLGEDRNGDGLPDAWQRRINSDINKVRPGDDADRDGLTNLEEYFAGTYALDPKSGFVLTAIRNPATDDAADASGGVSEEPALLEFTVVSGRSYRIVGSPDLKEWSPVSFRLQGDAGAATPVSSYAPSSVARIQVRVVPASDETVYRFFKLIVE